METIHKTGPDEVIEVRPDGAYELILVVEQFGYTLEAEFVRISGATVTRLGAGMTQFGLLPNSQPVEELDVSCPNLPGLGIGGLYLHAGRTTTDTRRYGVRIGVAVAGLRRDDVFRVRSKSLQFQQDLEAPNLNANAKVTLYDAKAPHVAIVTINGVGTAWMQFPLSTIS